jgi:ribosomal protein L37AE/L43A
VRDIVRGTRAASKYLGPSSRVAARERAQGPDRPVVAVTGRDSPRNQYLQQRALVPASMSLEMDHDCPACGEERTFWRTASTHLHLGEKIKWRCSECEYGFVRIGDIDTSVEV